MISLTVPVYNEREALASLFENVQAVMHQHFPKNWEIIFVNDGSSDQTLENIKQLVQEDDRVKFITFSKNFASSRV